MLIQVCDILDKRPNVRKALVVGAGELEQKREFDLCGLTDVTWVEARSWAVTRARDKYPHANVHGACVTAKADKTVKFWEQHPASVAWSSTLEPSILLTKACPYARVHGHRFYVSKTLDHFLGVTQYDMLQLDVCGSELAILSSTTCALPHLVHVKVYRQPLFVGGTTVDKIDSFFVAVGYSCILEQWASNGLVGEKVFAF